LENEGRFRKPTDGLCHAAGPLQRTDGGHDCRNFEPRKWLKFDDIDKSIQELRVIFKVHPEWFEAPKPKSDKGQNVLDYSIN